MLAVLRRRDAIRPRRCRYRRTDNGGERETERETATSIAAPAAPAAACSSAGTGCVSAATNAERRGQPCRVDGQVDAHAGRDSPEGPPCGAAFDCALAPAALERHDGFAALPCHALQCAAMRSGAGAERLHGAGCTACCCSLQLDEMASEPLGRERLLLLALLPRRRRGRVAAPRTATTDPAGGQLCQTGCPEAVVSCDDFGRARRDGSPACLVTEGGQRRESLRRRGGRLCFVQNGIWKRAHDGKVTARVHIEMRAFADWHCGERKDKQSKAMRPTVGSHKATTTAHHSGQSHTRCRTLGDRGCRRCRTEAIAIGNTFTNDHGKARGGRDRDAKPPPQPWAPASYCGCCCCFAARHGQSACSLASRLREQPLLSHAARIGSPEAKRNKNLPPRDALRTPCQPVSAALHRALHRTRGQADE